MLRLGRPGLVLGVVGRPLVERDDALPGRLDDLLAELDRLGQDDLLLGASGGRPCRSPGGTSGPSRRSRSCRPRGPRAPRRSASRAPRRRAWPPRGRPCVDRHCRRRGRPRGAAGRGTPGSSWSSGGSGEETPRPTPDGISTVGPSATNREQPPSTVYLQRGHPAESRRAPPPRERPQPPGAASAYSVGVENPDSITRPLRRTRGSGPADERRRRDQKAGPSVARDRPTGRAEQDSVDGPELRWAGLPPEDSELIAKDEDLEILGTIVGTRTDEEPGQCPNYQAEQERHRRILGCGWSQIRVFDPHGFVVTTRACRTDSAPNSKRQTR